MLSVLKDWDDCCVKLSAGFLLRVFIFELPANLKLQTIANLPADASAEPLAVDDFKLDLDMTYTRFGLTELGTMGVQPASEATGASGK